jgi:phospholipase/carboxylesterase
MFMNYLPSVELETNPTQKVQAAVIWLHGLGSNGHDFESLVPELSLPAQLNIRFIFPHAPSIPVTINNGYVMPAWYDIVELSLNRKVDVTQLCASADQVMALVEREIARGIPSHKILLAGFSQGGAVVFQAALSSAKPLAGLLILSSYFATSDTITLQETNKKMPILIQHGTEDTVVDESLGQRAYKQLRELGYNASYESYPMQHSVCYEQIKSISRWLQERLS